MRYWQKLYSQYPHPPLQEVFLFNNRRQYRVFTDACFLLPLPHVSAALQTRLQGPPSASRASQSLLPFHMRTHARAHTPFLSQTTTADYIEQGGGGDTFSDFPSILRPFSLWEKPWVHSPSYPWNTVATYTPKKRVMIKKHEIFCSHYKLLICTE